ncbi:FxsB family cyclophane-forming radical SAM/SPASM peptide maturase [Streptacidiphilus sp. EB103A]|uniref:FxsB family cyclophane-forming radical SAM/SPASM peptide maturase n=1 Tax=Streptacidiphilus sp. EB103A TaxID=3156275 RepID=UPI0035171D76
MPFRQFVVKLHSRCDLACDHCYIYEHADTQWKGRPRAASGDVLPRTAKRIAEHARAHSLDTVHVVLHGGEPLLAGVHLIRLAAEELRRELSGVSALDLRIHTNGVLLDRRFLDLFAEYDIKVGISLDGDRAANDLHRRYADGRSSYAKVLKAIDLLQQPEYRRLFAGLLCTIDVRNDPIAVYDALLALKPPRLDFLLPHSTWDEPPLRPDGPESTPYADWLGAVYRRWEDQGRPVPVRTFDSVLRTLHGLSSLTENLGLEPADLVVVETDGTLEQADSLKTAYDGASATGFNVFDHDFDTAARHPGMIDRQHGLEGLCQECRNCPVVRSCGGGLYAHRYESGSAGTGFDNPSVFCRDLLTFIGDVAEHERMTGEPRVEAELLSEDQLDQLASGYGDADVVALLGAEQLEIGRELLATVWDRAADRFESKPVWDLLTTLDAEAPEALDATLAHPYTRAWAMRCLDGDAGADLGGMAEIAAVAVLRVGVEKEVPVPVRRGGVLRLPGLGLLLLDGPGTAIVSGTADGFTAALDGVVTRVRWTGADRRWQPVRRIAAGPDWTVALEDTDPQRDIHQWPVADRLDDAELAAWEAGLTEAWRFVHRAMPRYAGGVAAGLSNITPLQSAPPGKDVSAAARDAFGTVGIARPTAADTLALLIVHEFQHVKLGAVLDVHDLFDRDDARLFRVPWRDDPRPLEGVFQGTYAHVAVTEYWRARWHDLSGQVGVGATADHALAEFARWLGHTAEALGILSESGSLTRLGGRFVAGMEATLTPWLDELRSDHGDTARPVVTRTR